MTHSNLDTLTRIVREIADSELTDPKLEARIGDDEAYEEWGRGVGALSLLGKLEPWGAQVLEVVVKFSGTYRPHPAMDPIPGIPVDYLLNGGPDGSFEQLKDAKPTQAFWKRVERLIEVVNRNRGPRLRFYLKSVDKSATGFRGLQTAAYSISSLTMPAAPTPTGNVLRLSRAK